jgi:hypothetical protein
VGYINKKGSCASLVSNSGAGEESRTLDLNLGKVALYQLSYSRIGAYRLLLCYFVKPGAGEESRTLDLNLGKVALYQLSYSRIGVLLVTALLPQRNTGAGEESRTLDLNLGKVALYQLSYSRMLETTIIAEISLLSKTSLLETAWQTWSGRRVSNSRPQPWQGCALPTELLPLRPSFAASLSQQAGIIDVLNRASRMHEN